MRKLVVISLCFIFLMGVTPIVLGAFVQTFYQDALVKQSGETFTVKNIGYEQGWFQSTAVTQFELQDAELVANFQATFDTNEPLQLIVEHSIQHGPLLFTENGIQLGLAATQDTIRFSDAWMTQVKKVMQSDVPATASAFVSFFGEADVTIHIAAIDSGSDLPQVSFAATDLNFRLSDTWQTLDGSISNAKIRFRTQEEQFELQDFLMDVDVDQYIAHSLPLGQWHVSFASSQLSKNDTLLLNVKGFKSEINLQQHKDKPEHLSFSQKNHIDLVEVAAGTYGPMDLDFLVSHFPAQVFARVMTSRKADVVRLLMFQLLRDGLSVEVETLTLKTPQGDVVGELSAQLPPLTPEQVQDMAYLKANSAFNVDLSAPIDFIDATPLAEQVPLLLMFGLLENKDGVYSLRANLKDAKLQLNGRDMPF